MDYKIISKFIKDISFEISNVQSFIMLEKEINTTLKMVPNQDVKHKIFCEITGASLVSIGQDSKNKSELEKIVLVTVPQEIYPTLYDTFVYLFKQAEVKNIKIHKVVDFQKLFDERKK